MHHTIQHHTTMLNTYTNIHKPTTYIHICTYVYMYGQIKMLYSYHIQHYTQIHQPHIQTQTHINIYITMYEHIDLSKYIYTYATHTYIYIYIYININVYATLYIKRMSIIYTHQ